MFLVDAPSQNEPSDDQDQTDPDEQMQRMESGHDEVQQEKELNMWRIGPGPLETVPGTEPLGPVFVVFNSLDCQENDSKRSTDKKKEYRDEPRARFIGCGRQGYGQPAGKQYSRVNGSKHNIQFLRTFTKCLGITEPINTERQYQRAKEHNLGPDKDPDPAVEVSRCCSISEKCS